MFRFIKSKKKLFLPKLYKNGFTLIEILVAIAIISILATVLLANYQGIRARARDSQRKKELDEIKTALRLFYNDNQVYPIDNEGKITCDTSSPVTTTINWGDTFICSGTTYMSELPQDPLAGNNPYYYIDTDSGDGFEIYACLENTADPNRDDVDGGDDDECDSSGYVSYTIKQD